MMQSWPPRWLTPVAEDVKSRGPEVAEFIDTFVTLTKDSVSGQVGSPIQLRDWQHELLRQMFALNPDGAFKHRTMFVGMGRKNGKSALAAGIGLWSLFMHDQGGETYSCAATKDQARITFNDARKLIEGNPELKEMCKVYRDAIELPSTGSIWRVLASESFGAEGLNASAVIFDEIHALQDRKMWDVMQLSMASRRQPLMIATTTAGLKTDSTGKDSTAYGFYKHLKQVASGEVEDPTFFGAWWEAEPEADHREESSWIAANPGYGDLNSIADFEAMVKRTPEAEFRTKRCNQWVNTKLAWLPAGAWDSLEEDYEMQPEDEYVLGFDGSWKNDSTALVAVVLPKDEEQPFRVVHIKSWEKDFTLDDDSWRVDKHEVSSYLLSFYERFPKMRELVCDPSYWEDELWDWNAAGLPVVAYRNSTERTIPATAKLFDAIMSKQLRHDGSPAMARHIDNCILKIDNRGARITKDFRQPKLKVDNAIALMMAYDRASGRIEEQVVPQFFA
jgi:phage terminase large subunit-like protein